LAISVARLPPKLAVLSERLSQELEIDLRGFLSAIAIAGS
jgi:hypothetical protein